MASTPKKRRAANHHKILKRPAADGSQEVDTKPLGFLSIWAIVTMETEPDAPCRKPQNASAAASSGYSSVLTSQISLFDD